MAAEILDPAPEAADENPETTEAYDEALLDMVALEMGAPDPDEFDDAPVAAADEIDAMELPEPMPAEPVTFASETVPWAAPQPLPAQASLQPSLEPSPKPDVEPSLGSTFLAGGFLQKPKPSASDPLAPIRRMSQAEKIAFFS